MIRGAEGIDPNDDLIASLDPGSDVYSRLSPFLRFDGIFKIDDDDVGARSGCPRETFWSISWHEEE